MQIKSTLPRRSGALACVSLFLVLASQPSFAAFKDTLNLTNFNPDLNVSQLAINYTLGTGDTSTLSITGTGAGNTSAATWKNTLGALAGSFSSVQYSLTASLSGNGSVLDSGSFSIVNKGSNNLGIATDALLLSGTLYNFGVSGSGNSGTFEFQFQGLDSDARTELEWNFAELGQIIFSTDTIDIDSSVWLAGNSAFSSTSGGADHSVPVPAPLALLAFGLIGIRWIRARR